MSGKVGDLSEAQQKALDELKRRVAEWIPTVQGDYQPSEYEMKLLGMDAMYLKFLRARKWDLEAAYKQYTDTVIWRQNFQGIGVAACTEDTIVNELKSGKSFFYQYDKKNRAVVYIRPRLHIPSQTVPEENLRFVVWHMETGAQLLKPGVETGLVIYDMNGFGLSNMDYSQVKSQIHLLESYYPESMGLTLIVNAPWLFSACWRLIKTWIDPVAAEKIVFVSQEQLLNYIDKDKLLKVYGGDDPYEYQYLTKEEREGTHWAPSWELPWAVDWKKEIQSQD